jgi:hypothetical protein
MRTFMQNVVGLVEMCVIGHSPWLFEPRCATYNVTSSVHVRFEGIDHEEREEFITTLRNCNHIIQIDTSRADGGILIFHTDLKRYESWERECGFAFNWEDLTLQITRSSLPYPYSAKAFFIDNENRTSKLIFLEDGPEYNYDKENIIPWLHCMS